MLEQCNNAEFVFSYFSARYCMLDFVFPGSLARFEDVGTEEGDPYYSVSGRIDLYGREYCVKLSVEQKTLIVTAGIYPVCALSAADAGRFTDRLPGMIRDLPEGFSAGLVGKHPFFVYPIHAEQTVCGEEEITEKLRFALAAADASFRRFRGYG